MKNFILFICSSFTSLFLFAQTGPGGVGSSANLEAWLDASELTLSNNAAVSSWTDFSGNNNDADQSTASNQPIFKTNQINGHPAVEFDGAQTRLEISPSISGGDITLFMVNSVSSSNVQTIMHTDKNLIYTQSNTQGLGSANPWSSLTRPITQNNYHIFNAVEADGPAGASRTVKVGNNTRTNTRNDLFSFGSTVIGSALTSSYIQFYDGSIAEIILFNTQLNSAKRKIVSNYLAAKYNLTAEQNLYAHKTTHGNEVIGVGQEADGSHIESRGRDSLLINNATLGNNGDYILIGNDDADFSIISTSAGGVIERWNRTWRVDKTGTPGAINVQFFLTDNGFASPSDYVVIIEEDDGNFNNGGTRIIELGSFNSADSSITFSGIDFVDGATFTLAEKTSVTPPSIDPIDYGPGGVGNTVNIVAWLDANRLSLSNNSTVSSWTDFSGNNNDADQSTASNQPIFKTNQINGHPAVEFDGAQTRLEISPSISGGDITLFMVNSVSSSNVQTIMHTDKNLIYTQSNTQGLGSANPWSSLTRPITQNNYHIFNAVEADGPAGASRTVRVGNNTRTNTRNDLFSFGSTVIGSALTSSYIQFYDGSIAEIILYNTQLNSAKRKIVGNHLAAKYNLTAEQNLYAHKTTHGNEVIGIGQESDGSHIEARGRDSLLINNATLGNNGDYILIGNDDADFSIISTSAGGVIERWNRTWRVDKTGTAGAINVQFFLTDNGFASPSDYVVIIEEDDGNFSNGGTRIIELGSFNSADSSITFSGIDFADGATFTLAEKIGIIESIADTDWSLNSTWNCDCVPTQNDTVNVINDVTISSNQEVFNLSISNGSITFSGSDTLDVYGSLAIGAGGSVSAGNGTIAVTGTSAAAQTLDNTSGSIAALNNLFINSTNGANIESGGWSISNSLQVSSGGLDVTNADSVVLVSNVTSTAQILESMSGAFTGEFIVQRFINSRNANYSNHSSPISDATVADLDDDLILSGVGGVNGNAGPPSNIFRSMYFFDSPTDAYVAITSLTTSLPSGTGYEVYLADTIGSFYGATVDYRGTLFNGDLTSTVIADQGWNLIGNPYQSFIDYTAVSKGTLPNEYYIYNSSTGNYDFFSGTLPNIAPGQGFWVEKTTPGNQFIDFQENDKVDNNSSSFLRTKTNPSFSLGLSSAQTDFSHKMEVNFDVNAISELDELDASYLKSPVKDAPAIYSRATNSDKDLIVNSLNPFEESQLIPIEIYAGLDGAYSIDAENVTELYKDYSCVYLKDKATNKAVDLSVDQSYQFETTQGTSDRFELIVSNSFVECEKLIEDGSFEQKLDHQLSLRNAYGDWYLDYTLNDSQQQVEIRILNMAGQEVKNPISFGASNAGTYRLYNLQDLNGIYLIQVKTKDGFLNKTVQL